LWLRRKVSQRLGRDIVEAVGENRVQAQDRAGSGHADDHLAVAALSGGELEIAAADQIKVERILSLCEERRLRFQRDSADDHFQIGQHGAAQRAEPAGAPVAADRASHRNLPGNLLLPRLRYR
jgi:hypothetical protein